MKTKIILAPGAGGSEMLRMFARFGVNTIGVKVVSGVELAKDLLMKTGISVREKFLTSGEESSVIFSLLSGIPYFRAASFADAENLSGVLYTMRSLLPEEEETGLAKALDAGEFKDKNDALLAVYKQFIAKCTSEGRIDRIGIIRKAIAEAKPSEAEYVILKEFPLSPLERALVDFASQGQVKVLSLLDILGVEPEGFARIAMTEGYGAINEVEDIIDRIYREGLPLDRCQIACANSAKYSQLIYDLAGQYNIPVTFGCGVPIGNANPARLLKLLLEWDTLGFNGVDYTKKLLFSEAFDRRKLANAVGLGQDVNRKSLEKLAQEAGNLRLSRDSAENKRKLEAAFDPSEEVAKLAEELEKGYAYLIGEYSVIRPEPEGRIDQSGVKVILQQLRACGEYLGEGELNNIIPKLLKKTVSSENSRQGFLHITSIKGAMASMRENLFVCGLSANDFPGAIKENYLMLDSDLDQFGQDKIPTSVERIKDKIENLNSLLALASGVKSRILLSYPGYDLAELKDQNPSSVLFEIFEAENPGQSMEEFKLFLGKAEYFKSNISKNRYIGDKYTCGAELDFKPDQWVLQNPGNLLERAWSPSALEDFFRCPRRFYLTRVLGIPDEEADDPFQVLSAAEIGTLAHELMELLGREKMTVNEFVKRAREEFDRALTSRPPMHDNTADRERIEFLQMMEAAYQQDPGNKVLSAETEYTCTHPSGVTLHGYPDRIEEDAAGRFKVIDFKTKRKIEHVQDDIATCLQVVIYAWLCRQNGIDISSCEYRYLRKKKSVTCEYNDGVKNQLTGLLEAFKAAIEKGDYPRNPGDKDENCRYCSMAEICSWPQDQDNEEEVSDD